MTNQLKIIGESYKKFNDKNTSVSANKLPHAKRCMERYWLKPDQRKKCTNASLAVGTIGHDIVEICLNKNLSVEEVMASKQIQDKINSYIYFDETDKMKFKFAIKFLTDTAKNHLLNFQELPKQTWQTEVEFTTWLPNVQIFWKMFCDAIGKINVVDIKYKLPSVKYSPLKTKQKKENPNRINEWVCSHSKLDARVYTSDLMQMALYAHTTGLKPALSYASATDRILFTEDNCDDLKPKNLKNHLNELIAYEIAWEKKLKAANGSLEELMWLAIPDFSEVRKKSFWWNGIPQEFINDYLKFYEIKKN
tara:strand:+ start:19 stop:939 length:921 start_codon:yes stop_codon:yes gene_type:complete